MSDAVLLSVGCLVDTKCAGFALSDSRKAVDGIHDVHPELTSYARDTVGTVVGIAAAREV